MQPDSTLRITVNKRIPICAVYSERNKKPLFQKVIHRHIGILSHDFRQHKRCGIVIKERPKEGSKELGAVETDDYCNFLVDFENGVTGTFSITRCAIGHNNTIKYQIFGTKGVISFDLTRTDILQVCLGEIDTESCGMHEIKVPKRFSISQEQMFIDLLNGKECSLLPTIADGLKCQKILDALLLSSENKQWVDLI